MDGGSRAKAESLCAVAGEADERRDHCEGSRYNSVHGLSNERQRASKVMEWRCKRILGLKSPHGNGDDLESISSASL